MKHSPAAAGRRTAIGAALVLAVAFASLSASSHDRGHDHPAAGQAGHDPVVTRTILGPLTASSPDATVQLEVALGLGPADAARPPRQPPDGIPAGEKVLVTVRLANPATGAPLAGGAPRLDPQADGQLGGLADGDPPPARDPFEVRETFALVGPTGDLGVIEDDASASHSHAPGARLARTTASGLTGMVKLPGPSAEAAVGGANRYLFATLPTQDRVAVVDLQHHRLLATLPVGRQPDHLAADPTGRRVWVANDGDGTVTAIDAETHRTRSVAVGAGHHELAFSTDGRLVFVSNSGSGTVSVVDAEQARVIAEAPVGSTPHGLDYAADSGRLYVANEGSGTVSVLAVTDSLVMPVGEIPAGAGTTQVRIDPSGRTGVASNRRANTLTVFDASSGEVVKTVPAGAGPDGIVFLDGYAVVRNSLSPDVTFVNLRNPDIADEIAIGTEPVLAGPRPGVHARPFLNATGDEVLVPSPAAGILQHLHVMMGRPMAMDQTRVGQGTAFLLSLTNEVQEVSPGTYQRMVRFDRAGTYTLRVSLGPDRPQPLAEFALPVVSSSGGAPWLAEPVAPPGAYIAGQEGVVQYRVTDRRSGAAVEGLRDAVISVYRLAPGQAPWQRVLPAEDAGDGLYQARVVFPEPGTFSATITSRELGLRPEDGARGTVEVVDGG